MSMTIRDGQHGASGTVADAAVSRVIPAAPFGVISASSLASSLILGGLLLLIGP
jgi:hypothetical protein